MKHQTPESMKFKKLQRRLGESRRGVAGLLELLWITVQKNAPQGDIGRFSNEEIAIECDWENDPDELVESLVTTGWIDRCSVYRLVVHDWEDHAPGWLKRQNARHKKEFVTASSLLTVTDDCLETTTGSPIAPRDCLEATPNLTQPNLTQPNQDTTYLLSGADKSAAEQLVMEFPVKSSTDQDWKLLSAKMSQWVETYGEQSWVESQLRMAKQWLLDNPAKQKTPGGMSRFLGNWLAKSNNRGSGISTTPKNESRVASDDDLANWNPHEVVK